MTENNTAEHASPDDVRAIEQTCRNYVDGWFRADEESMRAALHPELAKRGIWYDLQAGAWKLKHLSADELVGYARQGGGSALDDKEKAYEIFLLDVFRDIATVKLVTSPYMEYIHLARINGRWWIVNVLYELRQGEETQP